jgi:hypothetical protein
LRFQFRRVLPDVALRSRLASFCWCFQVCPRDCLAPLSFGWFFRATRSAACSRTLG